MLDSLNALQQVRLQLFIRHPVKLDPTLSLPWDKLGPEVFPPCSVLSWGGAVATHTPLSLFSLDLAGLINAL